MPTYYADKNSGCIQSYEEWIDDAYNFHNRNKEVNETAEEIVEKYIASGDLIKVSMDQYGEFNEY